MTNHPHTVCLLLSVQTEGRGFQRVSAALHFLRNAHTVMFFTAFYIKPRDMLASSVKLQVFPNMQGMDHPAVSSLIVVLKPAVTSFRS